MCKKFTADELNQMDHTAKNDVIFQMQDRLDKLEQELNEAFGAGNWKSMPDEIFWQLRFEPAR